MNMNPWERTALYAAEKLIIDGVIEARSIVNAIDTGAVIDDDDSLRALLAPFGVDIDKVYRAQDALVYSYGKRVTMPENPCLVLLSGPEMDVRGRRPCVRPAGHPDSCMFADVPLRYQRAAITQLRNEQAAVLRALSNGI